MVFLSRLLPSSSNSSPASSFPSTHAFPESCDAARCCCYSDSCCIGDARKRHNLLVARIFSSSDRKPLRGLDAGVTILWRFPREEMSYPPQILLQRRLSSSVISSSIVDSIVPMQFCVYLYNICFFVKRQNFVRLSFQHLVVRRRSSNWDLWRREIGYDATMSMIQWSIIHVLVHVTIFMTIFVTIFMTIFVNIRVSIFMAMIFHDIHGHSSQYSWPHLSHYSCTYLSEFSSASLM